MKPELSREFLNNLLREGVDERIYPDENGINHYGVDITNDDILNRGSCTCNSITPDNLNTIKRLLDENKTDEDWKMTHKNQENDLKTYINYENEDLCELIFAPSGTDTSYIPIIISTLIHPNKPILNLITCFEELGSGILLAAAGKYHAEYNQFQEKTPKGEVILKHHELTTHFISAREKGGGIINPEQEIKDTIAKFPNHSIIINLVLGSKSGIQDNVNLIDKIKADNIIWNVDMCQFRHRKKIINNVVKKGALVMITGSKFYQSMPFCGATLIPKTISESLGESKNWKEINNFNLVFSKLDCPRPIRLFAELPEYLNKAGIIRWQCALDEMDRFNKIPIDVSDKIIDQWNKKVTNELNKYQEFELMPDQDMTNKTIISFRLKNGDHFLNHKESKELFFEILNGNYKKEIGFKNLVIGQPVEYGQKSFLRLAIGSFNIRKFLERNEQDYDLESKVIAIIHAKLLSFNENNKRKSREDLLKVERK